MRYPQQFCGNYEMPVALVFGVPLLAVAIMMLMVGTVCFTVRSVSIA